MVQKDRDPSVPLLYTTDFVVRQKAVERLKYTIGNW